MAHTPDPARFCVTCGQPVDGVGELLAALEKSVSLQSHYASLLNMHDGGERLQFASAETWLARLAKIAKAEGG